MLYPVANCAHTYSSAPLYAKRERILKTEMEHFLAKVRKLKHEGEKRRAHLEELRKHTIKMKRDHLELLFYFNQKGFQILFSMTMQHSRFH